MHATVKMTNSLTLLRHCVVVHSRLRRVSAATILLLCRIQLGVRSHRMALLGVAVCHLRHARGRNTTIAAAHAVTTKTTAARWIASSRSVVRGLINTNSAAIESIGEALSVQVALFEIKARAR